MANTRWQGGSPGSEDDPAVVGNWTDGLPDATTRAFFVTGSNDVAGGLISGTWLGVHFGSGYKGKFGLATNYVKVKIGVSGVDYQGANNAFLDISDNEAPIDVRVKSNSGILGLYLKTPTTAGVRARESLRINSTPVNTETVTVETRVYTFHTTLDVASGSVLIGADATESMRNLINAINEGPGRDVVYSAATAKHEKVIARELDSANLYVESILTGTDANAYATEETIADALSVWGDTTMSGGVDDLGVREARVERGSLRLISGRIALARMAHVQGIRTDSLLEILGGTVDRCEKVGGTLNMTVNTSYLGFLKNSNGSVKITAGHLRELENEVDGTVDWQTDDGPLVARIYGGHFSGAGSILPKTINHISMYGESTVDLNNGVPGTILLIEGGVWVFGSNRPNLLTGAILGEPS